jgi:uncharacterized protein (DUF983 family)
MSLSSAVPARSIKTGLLRGMSGRCPDCGAGKLFGGYLKVNRTCSSCGHATGEYRADDGPAYFTILLIGHLVIAPMLAFEFIRTLDPMLLLGITLPTLLLMTLLLLRVAKGGMIGVLWATRAGAKQ